MSGSCTHPTKVDRAIRRWRSWCARALPWQQQFKKQSIELIAKYQVQDWFQQIPLERAYAYDIIKFLASHARREGLIVEIGCGIGQNFIELFRFGFYRFLGVDHDDKAIACARELLKRYNIDAELRFQEGCQPLQLSGTASVWMPLNWTYCIEDLSPIFCNASKDLEPQGFFIIDIIEKKYNCPYNTADAHLPVERRRPSEYPYRYTADEVEELGTKWGFRLLKSVHKYFPRFVMYFQKE